MTRLIAAAIQMTSTADKDHNLDTASRLVEEAAGRGATLAVLPELVTVLGEPEVIVAGAEEVPGPASRRLGELAARLEITLLAGSLAERRPGHDRISNTSLLLGPDGRQLAAYRKLHLFDIDLPDRVSFQESAFVEPGDSVVVTDTPAGRLGQATCYDLRFPELFRALVDRGAEIITVPSAFTQATGRDHWQVLLRARAIENQVFIVAANQFGNHAPGITTYGRSVIIDPWGTVLATAADGEGVITAELDHRRQAEIRESLPALKHRRDLGSL
ncbi:MAG: carbon-nitrogen hydrolase family protein [Planctomycetaceae bacterium]|nr:carbon-nitrogen hydrolase family protein [Planctomycetaceae bacterium]